MARIRTIKPDFFLDEDLTDLPHESRLWFVGLWTQSDREGRLEDRPKMLKSQIFPYENANPEKLINSLAPRFIQRYEVDGKRYIQIVHFSKHQRPHHTEKESVIPAPPPLLNGALTVIQPSRHAMEGKGKEGNGKVSILSDGFISFWTTYPRKDSKQEAMKAWCKLKPGPEVQAVILADLKKRAQSADWQNEGGKYIPLPATYLNGARWENQGVTLPAPSAKSGQCPLCGTVHTGKPECPLPAMVPAGSAKRSNGMHVMEQQR